MNIVEIELLKFSLAAPLTALTIYAILYQSQLMAKTGQVSPLVAFLSSPSALGLLLIFSAGTFIYTIAAHILPNITRKEGHRMELKSIIFLIIGILTPMILQPGHHHH